MAILLISLGRSNGLSRISVLSAPENTKSFPSWYQLLVRLSPSLGSGKTTLEIPATQSPDPAANFTPGTLALRQCQFPPSRVGISEAQLTPALESHTINFFPSGEKLYFLNMCGVWVWVWTEELLACVVFCDLFSVVVLPNHFGLFTFSVLLEVEPLVVLQLHEIFLGGGSGMAFEIILEVNDGEVFSGQRGPSPGFCTSRYFSEACASRNSLESCEIVERPERREKCGAC
jgi:hypothetical protein